VKIDEDPGPIIPSSLPWTSMPPLSIIDVPAGST
jgi:hypothetical protein